MKMKIKVKAKYKSLARVNANNHARHMTTVNQATARQNSRQYPWLTTPAIAAAAATA